MFHHAHSLHLALTAIVASTLCVSACADDDVPDSVDSVASYEVVPSVTACGSDGASLRLIPNGHTERLAASADRTFAPVVGDAPFAIDGAVVYPVPAVACIDGACPDADLAARGYTCGGVDGQLFCALPIAEPIPLDGPVTTTTATPGATLVLITNGGSMLGLDENGGPSGVCSSDRFDQRTRSALTWLQQSQSRWACAAVLDENGVTAQRNSAGACFGAVSDPAENDRIVTDLTRIGSTETTGTPATLDALEQLGALFDEVPDASRSVLLVTDGMSLEELRTDSTRFETALQSLRAAGIVVHVAQFTNRRLELETSCPVPVSTPVPELQRLACETGGLFSFVERPETLQSAANIANVGFADTYDVRFAPEDIAAPPYRLDGELLFVRGGLEERVPLDNDPVTDARIFVAGTAE